MPCPRFRVAICGGGIGGLCLAVALSKHSDIQVDLYEAAARFKEIGAGVMIWSRTWEILTLLGLDGKFAEIAHAPPDGSNGALQATSYHAATKYTKGVGFDYRKSDQPEEGHRFYLFERPYGCIRFHRAQFLDVFVDALPEGVAHFGKRLMSYSQTSSDTPVKLHFSDNTSAVCDVLIGCDGIKSTIRKQMLEEKARMGQKDLLRNINPIWTGTTVYRGLIPVDRLKSLEARLPQALLAYEHVRLPLANHVLRGSYESGKMYEFDGPQGDSLQGLGPALEKQWDWLDQTTPTGEADRAVERLEDMVQNE
ncbi:hypothetical protein EVJ58_g3580 [Rhodofomes roseus]|uniref:FAD-binding domain-containing protein n=1 Tax=Rhodofomes roseus TaxID=34475 RepID=A0A4Y9YK38_9APHY|nr:hypothetical protein EVJ58_g3580 [Rhodofomes roseus]